MIGQSLTKNLSAITVEVYVGAKIFFFFEKVELKVFALLVAKMVGHREKTAYKGRKLLNKQLKLLV